MFLFSSPAAKTLIWLAAILAPLQGLPLFAGGCRCGASGKHQCGRMAAVSPMPSQRQQCCHQKAEVSVPPCCRGRQSENRPCCGAQEKKEATPVSSCCQGAAVCLCAPSDSPSPVVPPPSNGPTAKELCCPAAGAVALLAGELPPPLPQFAAEGASPPLTPLDRCSTLCRFVI